MIFLFLLRLRTSTETFLCRYQVEINPVNETRPSVGSSPHPPRLVLVTSEPRRIRAGDASSSDTYNNGTERSEDLNEVSQFCRNDGKILCSGRSSRSEAIRV